MHGDIDRFDRFGFPAEISRRIGEAGHDAPSHVQAGCIPAILDGRDLFAHTDSGTGKTLAFVLPLLATLDLGQRQPQVLVLTSTDETTIHVGEVFQDYARYLPDFHVLPLYHQTSALQMRQLSRGVHVIVGVPRRVMAHIDDHGLILGSVKRVILDEADRILQGGFLGDFHSIVERTAAPRQTAIFSATLSANLLRLVREQLRKPVVVHGTEKLPSVPQVRQRYWQLSGQSKLNALTRLFDVEPALDAALVFANDNAGAQRLAAKLNARGYAAAAIDGDSPPDLGARVAAQLRAGAIDVVVSTDLAAEGLVSARVTHVISYDAPRDTTTYLHRLNHFDPAGSRKRMAILLVSPREMGLLHSLERATLDPITPLVLPERFRS